LTTATFINATKLTTLIIRGTLTSTPKALTFIGTPFLNKLGYIYVPDGSIDRYTQYEFSAVADQVKKLSELEGGGDGSLQSKTVIPSESSQKVEPDEGYYGLSDVTVEAIPDIYKDITMVSATPETVLEGRTFVDINGNQNGTMPNNGNVTKILSTNGETFTIPKGYHDGAGIVVCEVEESGGDNPFEGIDDITGVLSEMTVVGNEQFKDIRLTEIRLPKVEQLGGYILGFNSITETLELGEKLTEISPYQISNCGSLKTLILQGICSLTTDASVTFSGTPIADGTGTVYVPDRYLEQYKSDTYWSDIASQIKPLSEYYGIEVEGVVSGIDPTWTDWRYFSYYNSRNSLVSKLKYSDTSNGTSFQFMFAYCSTLKSVPQIDTSNGTNFSSIFSGCSSLVTIPKINVSKATNASYLNYMFLACAKLENVTFEGVFPVFGNVNILSPCPNLTVDSLMSFINALENKGTTTRTVTIGSTNLAKLTPEQIQIATDKNITLA
jgi:hypothetical protein